MELLCTPIVEWYPIHNGWYGSIAYLAQHVKSTHSVVRRVMKGTFSMRYMDVR